MNSLAVDRLPPRDNDVVTTGLVVDYRTDAGTVRALECDPLTVAGGTSVAIMGPSGCGKSTLLGLLAGLALPTSGSVTVGASRSCPISRDRARTRFRRRTTGVVYQADNLLPHLTVEENVALPLSICGGRRPRRAPACSSSGSGSASSARRLPDQLSGGATPARRGRTGRSCTGPRSLLADEPTGALDPENATAVIELLTDVNPLDRRHADRRHPRPGHRDASGAHHPPRAAPRPEAVDAR